MSQNDRPPRIFSQIGALIFQDWHTLLSLATGLVHYLSRARNQGIFEILHYALELELLDPEGHEAVWRKRLKVRFLQDNIIAFHDYAWGDGENFTSYTCKPGFVADCYQEGDRWNVLISLRRTQHRGEIEEFYIERRVQDAFLKPEEWLQMETRHTTKQLEMTVIFPRERPWQNAAVIERGSRRVTTLGPAHRHEFPDGRHSLKWETQGTHTMELYTLKWQW